MTTTYLLLRDNKESGPYTFDELKAKGLKAYDLVWIEGRSAAWRYPCEIEELSAFAPMVEEQPFDRFYKKPSQTISSAPAAGRTSGETVVAAAVISADTSVIPGKRIIYVTLPAGKKAVEPPPAAKEPLPAVHEKYLPDHEDNTSQYNEPYPADVEITPRTIGRHRPSRIGWSVVVGLTVVALLAAGIFIGLSINKSSLGSAKNLSFNGSKDKPELIKAAPVIPVSQTLAANSPSSSASIQTPSSSRDSIVAGTQAASVIANIPSPKTTTPAKGKTTSAAQKTQTPATASTDSSLLAMPAVHREASHRADMSVEKADKDVIRNNLSNLVSLGASGYTVGTFGGITDLQLTVSNHSVYSLDLVVVEVQYIQANKKVFKTENLYFRGIAPGSALMQEAPKSSRGIKVQYKITLVNSKELGLSYSAL